MEAAKAPFPPYLVLEDFLPEQNRAALVEWAIASEALFKPAEIFTGSGGRKHRLDPTFRKALRHQGIGPFEALFRDHLLAKSQEIASATGYRGPPLTSLEFELNAYGDGAHFRPHIDIPVGPNRRAVGAGEGEDRVISAVYYFYREPKAFSGGALRLYRFGADAHAPGSEADSIAFEPRQNGLVCFPSWAMHKVETVYCTSDKFEDYRFGLNCWFCRPAAGSAATA